MNLMFNSYVTKATFTKFLDYMVSCHYRVVQKHHGDSSDVHFEKDGQVDANYQANTFKVNGRTKYMIGMRAH